MDNDALIATLARYAAAADNGVWLHNDCEEGGLEAAAAHKGAAKAYRHAIQLVIDAQRLSKALQRESEQKAS